MNRGTIMDYYDDDKIVILLVDSDPKERKKVLTILEDSEGYSFEIHNVKDGRGALEYLFREGKYRQPTASPRPDLVLLNIDLPDMDGFSVHEKILVAPETRNIPIIFLTEEERLEPLKKEKMLGVDEFVTKPFRAEIFLSRIHSIIERRRLYNEMARTDPLTQIFNRRAFEIEITRELRRLKRYDDVGSLIYIDLDGLKEFNNKNGRTMGDLVLVRFADMLRNQARDVDILGRHSGEEFVVFCPQTDAAKAEIAAYRILSRFKDLSFGTKPLFVSFSTGIAEAPRDGADFSALFSKAGKAIEKAKSKGRGQIVIYKEDEN